MSDPISVLNLFMGGDLILIEFRPPPLTFIFTYSYSIPLFVEPYSGISVTLELFPFAYVTLDVAIVSGSLLCLLNDGQKYQQLCLPNLHCVGIRL